MYIAKDIRNKPSEGWKPIQPVFAKLLRAKEQGVIPPGQISIKLNVLKNLYTHIFISNTSKGNQFILVPY